MLHQNLLGGSRLKGYMPHRKEIGRGSSDNEFGLPGSRNVFVFAGYSQ